MKMSQTAEYALRAMVWLANHPDAAWVAADLAERTQVPQGYLSKIMQTLATEGLVESRRGPGGGFSLARPPEEMTALDVINAIDPIESIQTCPLGYDSIAPDLCPLHNRLNEAIALVEKAFRDTRLSDLVKGTPLCASQCMK